MDGIKSWKTTVVAFVAFLASLLTHFGLELGAEVQGMIVTAAMFLIGLLAKDADKTGTTKSPRTGIKNE